MGGPVRPRIHYVSIARKSGKSYALAAFILTELMLEPNSAIYIFSDSERNSKAVLFHELLSIVALCQDPTLFKVHYDRVVYQPTGGFVMVRPSNIQAVQGINPTLCAMDELHLQRGDFVYNGALMAGAAQQSPMVLAVSTPGYDTTSLCHMVDQAVRNGEISGRVYGPPDPATCYTDREQWKTANPGLGYTFEMDSLESDFKLMPEHEFKRFRLGCWTETADAWLPYGAWAARTAPASLNLGDRIWVGFDGSHSGDSTALVACGETGHLTVLDVWEKPALGSSTWRVPRAEVMAAVDRLFADFDVQMMYGDPAYWHREFQEWDQAHPNRVVEFPWASPSKTAPACTAFFAAVMDGRLSHDGDTRLGRHVANAVNRPTPHGVVIEKWNKDSPRRIDLAVAAVMAYHGLATGLGRVSDLFVGTF